jgi:hypothetical protein
MEIGTLNNESKRFGKSQIPRKLKLMRMMIVYYASPYAFAQIEETPHGVSTKGPFRYPLLIDKPDILRAIHICQI